MFRHTFKSCKKLVSCCCIQIFQAVDLAGKLIFHSFQKRRCFAVNLKLKVYKIFHILLNILFVGIHHIFHCLSVFILDLERPLAFNQGNSFHLRNIQSCFFDPRRDQSFVKYIWLRMLFVKYFHNTVVTFIDGFIRTFYDNVVFFKFHGRFLLKWVFVFRFWWAHYTP